ncbi:Myeloid-Associated Differentiation Marker [Manis pentadactyla]|nr:Myeloid-Associated Differentiation Marker [Manis pentadactyla]
MDSSQDTGRARLPTGLQSRPPSAVACLLVPRIANIQWNCSPSLGSSPRSADWCVYAYKFHHILKSPELALVTPHRALTPKSCLQR